MWYLYALVAALFSALAATGEKKILQSTNPLAFSALLALFVFMLSFPAVFLIQWSKIKSLHLLVLYGKSLFGCLAFLMVMHAIKRMELSSALPLLVLTPGLVAFFAFFMLGDRLNGVEILGMGLLLCGTYVLQLQKGSGLLEPFRFVKRNRAYLFIFTALALFTFTSILDKALLGRYRMRAPAFFFFQHLFLAVNFGFGLLLFPKQRDRVGTIAGRHWIIILVVAIFTITYRYSHILAVQAGSVALALSLKRISVFLATVLGGRYFREHGLLRKGVATAIMLVGAGLILLY